MHGNVFSNFSPGGGITEISEVSIYNDEFRYKSLRFYIDSHYCIRNVGLVAAITSNLDTKKKKILLLLYLSLHFFFILLLLKLFYHFC